MGLPAPSDQSCTGGMWKGQACTPRIPGDSQELSAAQRQAILPLLSLFPRCCRALGSVEPSSAGSSHCAEESLGELKGTFSLNRVRVEPESLYFS